MKNNFDTQKRDFLSSDLSLLRDPSLRAFAQDDSQLFGAQRDKRMSKKAASFF